MDERELYPKVMGIEEARKANVPMPQSVKIPKSARLNSSGGHCFRCGKDTLEGHEDAHGMWHYRCSECAKNKDANSKDACPRCGCTAHENSVFSTIVDSHFGEKVEAWIKESNPFKPEIIAFDCLNCSLRWNTLEYEKYLLTKVVESVLPTSEFSEKNRKV